MDYAKYVGMTYPPPHGCLMMVADILRNEYEIPIPIDIAERVFETMRNHLDKVEGPIEGDVVLMKGNSWHVGLVTGPGTMIHVSQPGGEVVVERYSSLQWRSRIRGFYRWQ